MSIIVEDIEFSYYKEGKAVISTLSESFERDEVTVITGTSGSGKSTLLYLMAGIYPQNAGFLRNGSVKVEGQDISTMAPGKRCRLAGMMFQNADLQFCMDTPRNELIFVAENLCISPDEAEESIRRAMEFAGIEGLSARRLNTLSGGEKQKVMLACIYLMEPEWMLLDEAFANVDDSSTVEILDKLMQLHREKGIGIVAVDHRLEHWWERADRIVLIEDGSIAGSVSPKEPHARERLLEAGIQVGRENYPGLASMRDGSHKQAVAVETAPESVLKLRGFGISHDDRTLLSGVDLTFDPGRIYAIVGESGSGKSSFFGALTGLYDYTGSAEILGKEVRKRKRKDAGTLGLVTQSPQDQFLGGTVLNEVSAAFRKDPECDAKSEAILRDIGLWKYRDISPYLLSQGQQRRLGVAALMAYPCRLLLCDEPTYAQDRRNAITLMDSLCRETINRNAAMIFTTHDRQMAEDYSDVILKLEGGTIHE